ncbi:ATP-grasp domain-containing protein [Streptomyces sp. NBS 14/10]|uniref:ATP-grasp domain-containing protein n=1 Tax=Streptomyces sp. NBS 14/10 TaxID=1945643 RepID=UPI001180243D|nr:ATP-grasp domain-containing protein [Streptomyces sp. NBS 14/10]KAK1180122.1 ATP-grasp domain-containing protein [Streptomyces sp. NBS 14/10]NUS82494.1 ATP-grasp domain-containing protein [Streptomyces sp.]
MKTAFFIESNMLDYGPEGMRLTKEKGYRTHFVARDPSEYAKFSPNPVSIADAYSVVDTHDLVKLMHFFTDHAPDAVIAFDDYRLVQTAVLAERLGLPHAPVDGLLNCHFKDRSRSLTKGIGRSVAAVRVSLDEPGDISPLEYPCVVKPVDDAGSAGVRVCSSDDEYRAALRTIAAHQVNARGYRRAQYALVEEFIDGPEFTAELIWDDRTDGWRFLGFTKKLMAELPFRVELGAMFPYHFGTAEEDARIVRVVVDWLAAVGHRRGAAHVEFKIVDGVPALIEINPRLGGDQIRELMRVTIGDDVVDLYTRLYLGLPPGEPVGDVRGGYATSLYLTPRRTGLITSVTPPPELPAGILRATFTSGPMQNNGVVDNGDRLGHAISWADEFNASLAVAEAYLSQVEVKYA